MKKKQMLRLIAIVAIIVCSVTAVHAELTNIYWNGSAYEKGTPAMSSDSFSVLSTDQVESNSLIGANADGGIDYIFFNGVWDRDRNITGNTAQYNAVTAALNSKNMFVARDGALENTYWDGSQWQTALISSSTYTALATDAVNPNNYYAAGSSGLVNYYYSGGWQNATMTTNVYTDLSVMGQSHLYAIGDGRLDDVYYSGVWNAATINTNTYTSVAANVGTSLSGDMLAARDGSLDWVYYSSVPGIEWVTESISSDTFVDVVQAGTDLFYGAKADGGLYEIAYGGSDWSITLADSGLYSVIAPSNIEGAKNIYVSYVPEPATFAVIAVGGIATFLRRRK